MRHTCCSSLCHVHMRVPALAPAVGGFSTDKSVCQRRTRIFMGFMCVCGCGFDAVLYGATFVRSVYPACDVSLGNRCLVEMDSGSEDHRYGSSIEKRRLVSPLLDAMDCGVGQQRMSGDDANLAHNTVRGESRL